MSMREKVAKLKYNLDIKGYKCKEKKALKDGDHVYSVTGRLHEVLGYAPCSTEWERSYYFVREHREESKDGTRISFKVDNKEPFYFEKKEDSKNKGNSEFIVHMGNYIYDNIYLKSDTKIDDINSIRYQLGKIADGTDKEYFANIAGKGGMFNTEEKWIASHQKRAKDMAYFIDRFVIVTPEERKAYRDYVRQMEKKEKEAAKVAATNAAVKRKAEEKFFGR